MKFVQLDNLSEKEVEQEIITLLKFLLLTWVNSHVWEYTFNFVLFKFVFFRIQLRLLSHIMGNARERLLVENKAIMPSVPPF